MSVKSFKFVSPGIFVNEVDNSQLPALPGTMGPVIIGRTERGPAMVPVQVNSFSEFVETFGEPVAGTDAQDAWRDGNRLGPTYGAFAAQAYLRNGGPITFVRLLGEEHPNKEDQGKAGWKVTSAYGLYVGTDAEGSADYLAGVIYANSDGTPNAPTVVNTGSNAGNITLKIPLDAAAVIGSPASQSLTIEDASKIAAHGESFDIAKASDASIEIEFSTATASSSFAADKLTIGVADMSLDDTEASATLLLRRVAQEINKLSNAVAVTASASGKVLTLVMDEVGPVDISAEGTTAFVAGDLFDMQGNDPADFVLGAATTGVPTNPGVDTEGQFLVNFDRTSKNYIRKILNTSPTASNSDIDGLETYFLGATFDQFLEDTIGTDYYSEISHVALVPLSTSYKNHQKAASTAETPWILSQYMGDQASIAARATALEVADLNKLFKIHTLYSGAWEQKNFKISISGIKESTNEFNKYGTFSVLVRDASDSDGDMVVRERFTNVNLDPTSPRYIAAVIGDMKSVWQDEEKRYRQIGEYPNQSRYIRVEVSPEISSGAGNPEWLPYGFAAPAHAPIAGKVVPTFAFRKDTASEKSLGNRNQAFFGITTHRPESMGRFDPSYQDIVRPLFAGENMQDRDGALFSLDLIKQAADLDFEFAPATAANQDDYQLGTSINAIANNAAEILDKGCNKFTVPLVGGCDGLDITEVEPFCDDLTSGARVLGTTPKSNYAFYTLSKAIDIVSDPEVVECNIITIPGVATPGITGKLITTCESRADALAIVDLESDYTPRGWNTEPSDGEQGRLPKVREAVNLLKQRAINSSYGCAFFPWVQVRDDINNRLVWVPPSVVALGTMASSEKKSELWFAPAGFTRGGLSQGAGGLGVTQVRLRLNASERDSLYEANINPIAQFPAEGIVVFGQKTLQVTPSALDRINVRRLMIHVKKEVSRMAATVLFDQNLEATWQRFTNRVNPFLGSIKTRFGLEDYKVILDETTTTPELVDRNIVYAKIFLKPARSIEYIAIDFVITNSGASFED